MSNSNQAKALIFGIAGLIVIGLLIDVSLINKDKVKPIEEYRKVEQNMPVEQNNTNKKVNEQDSRDYQKEQENSKWERKQKEKEDEVKRQYLSLIHI